MVMAGGKSRSRGFWDLPGRGQGPARRAGTAWGGGSVSVPYESPLTQSSLQVRDLPWQVHSAASSLGVGTGRTTVCARVSRGLVHRRADALTTGYWALR